MKELQYFDLISPCGVYVQGVGKVHSPFLRDVANVGYQYYQYLLSIFLITPKSYYESLAKQNHLDANPYDSMTNEQKNEIKAFDVLTSSSQDRVAVAAALSLFISGELTWDAKRNAFLINYAVAEDGSESADGLINRDNFHALSKIMLQLADISKEEEEEELKFKNEEARKFYESFQKKKKAAQKEKKNDPRYDLANIISALCTFHNSINYTNVFDLTVYQAHDTFNRQARKTQLNIRDMNRAAWGGEYDPAGWFDCMDKDDATI